MELPDSCEGFHFRYFSADEQGEPIEVEPSVDSLRAEEVILDRVALILKNRPDIMRQLACMENAMEIHLYQDEGFKDLDMELYFIGRVTVDGDEVIMELSTDEVLYGGKLASDVLDIVGHELVHVIDFLDELDGQLPGWPDETLETFKKARTVEQQRIRENTSFMPGYGLVNDVEFLAVLGESFFKQPEVVRKENRALFDAMNGFFKLSSDEWAELA